MIVYGKQVFYYIVQRHFDKIKKVYSTKNIEPGIFRKLRHSHIPVIRIDNKKAQALAHGGNHQGVLLEIEDFSFASLQDVKSGNFLVVLYGITDVGNIGSIVRSAYALGADGVVVSGLGSLKMDGVIRRSSAAALDMPIAFHTNLYDVIKELQDAGFRVFTAHMEGKDVRKVTFEGKRAIVLGSEGEGVPKKALQKCDDTLKIAMKREFDSLNVAAAAAIFIDRMRDE